VAPSGLPLLRGVSPEGEGHRPAQASGAEWVPFSLPTTTSSRAGAYRFSLFALSAASAIARPLTSQLGAEVEVTMEIQARVPGGIPEKTVRDVSENCRTLKFRTFEFEKEQHAPLHTTRAVRKPGHADMLSPSVSKSSSALALPSTAQCRVVALLDRGVERVHVEMADHAKHRGVILSEVGGTDKHRAPRPGPWANPHWIPSRRMLSVDGFDERPRATPAIAGGRVFTSGAAGRLSCWSLADARRSGAWTPRRNHCISIF